MAVWDKRIVWGVVFLLAGVAGQRVNYPDPVCAVKGSTVTLRCTFTPLRSFTQNNREVLLKIVGVRWCQNHEICQLTTPTVYDSSSLNNNPRYKYLGDLKGNCTLQISELQQKDDATLRFRMEANHAEGHFTGTSGLKVTVTDGVQMQINSSRGDGGVRRGEDVTLYCTADCTFHQLEVTWFRGGHALPESGPALHIGYLTAEDSGNYTCGLKSNVSTRSLPYSLRVEEEDKLSLTIGVAFGVLLVLFSLIMVLCIIRRMRAADRDQRAGGGALDLKEGGRPGQDPGPPVEDVNYVSIQFKPKSRARPADEPVDGIIYSSVAGRG